MENPIIALSAGHGYYTSGKRCKAEIDPYTTREWYLNDRIIDKVEQKLAAYRCTVVRVNDTTGNTDTSLSSRVSTANKANASIYISMHHNAGVNGGSGGGTVVFYYPTSNNKEIATKLYNHIVKYTGLKGNRSVPVPSTTSLYEVRKPKAKAFLIENGFMDSTVDVPIILSESHAEKTALGVVDFLVEYFDLIKKNTGTNTTSNNSISSSVTQAVDTTYIRTQFIKDVQSAIGVVSDGIVGKKTLGALVTISKTKNNKHTVVKYLQKYLNSLGYNCGVVDGIFGTKSHNAVVSFQKKYNLSADGIVGKVTWQTLFNI